ncbi:MAG: ComEC family competence protein [Defluviitaleaceae bacterium]|nr:ComEC family competence protein [Defluviitaleaceae bacterium]
MSKSNRDPRPLYQPLLWAVGFLICGIVIGSGRLFPVPPLPAGYIPVHGAGIGLPLFVIAAAVGLLVCLLLFRLYRYWPVFIFLLLGLAGGWRVQHSLHNFTTQPIEIGFHGRVLDIGITQSGNQRVTIRGQHPVCGSNIRVMAYLRPHLPWASLGQQIYVNGELRPLSYPANPGGYNQFQHLRSQKIDAVIWPEEVSLGGINPSLTVSLRQFRDRLADVYDAVLPQREAAIIKSMVLGDRTAFDQDLIELYRNFGIFHVLSISGLHISVVMLAVSKILEAFLPKRRAGVLSLAVMILYCLLTGAAVATVRAILMVAVMIFGRVLYRDYNLLNSVSFAAIILLLYEPLYLFNAGFQLSFGAVYGIGILTVPIERLLAKLRMPALGHFRNGFSVGVAATVSTYVVLAFHFYEIQAYSVIGNLVVMPTSTILIIIGLAVGLVGLVLLPVAQVLAGVVYFILVMYELAAAVFTSLPHAMVLTGGGSVVIAALGALVLLMFAYAMHGFEGFGRRFFLFTLSVALLATTVITQANPSGLEITSLYARGEYTILRHRQAVLVAGSPTGGEDALLRYLDKRGISRASGLILSTPPRQADAARLARIAPRFDTIYICGQMEGATLSLAMQALNEMAQQLEAAGITPPQITPTNPGYFSQVGRLSTQIYSHGPGQLSLLAQFNQITLAIGAYNQNAHVTIADSSVVAMGVRYAIYETGALRLRIRNNRLRASNA